MAGATVLNVAGLGGGTPTLALIPLMVGLLAAFVAYGRWRLAPHRRRAGAPSGAAEPRPVSVGAPRHS
jgi:hypothetical protein